MPKSFYYNGTMNRSLLLGIFFFSSFLCATAPPGFFKRFPNRFFVETGSYDGEGIAQAIQAGFPEIHSIELSELFHAKCRERYSKQSNVHLWLGDSGEILETVIGAIPKPITFWLDGHWSGDPTARGKTNTPILLELEAIQRHPIKTHTILIDDIRCFGCEEFDFIKLSTIVRKIYQINGKYRITYARGHRHNDILVAQVLFIP